MKAATISVTVVVCSWNLCFAGIPCDPAVDCSGNGVCDANGACICDPGWAGAACDLPLCEQPCLNGTCTAPDLCTCDPGWFGLTCGNPICSAPCVMGFCIEPERCACVDGWAGAQCDMPVCAPVCQNGVCSAPGTCTCDSGWVGARCDVPSCAQPCVNGACVAPDLCACDPGWVGPLCDLPSCTPGCINGACTGPNSCTCDAGFTGPDCGTDIDECAAGPCDVNATCTNLPGSFDCACNDGFTGAGLPGECEPSGICPPLVGPGLADDDGNGIADACQPCLPQLLREGGFEERGESWNRAHFGGRSVVDSMAHGGGHALQMLGSPRYERRVGQFVELDCGPTFQAAVWAKTDGLGGDGVQTWIEWLDGDERLIQTDIFGQLGGTNDWTLLAGEVWAPAGAVFARFVLHMAVDPTGEGAAWFDDAELLCLSAACDDGDPCTVDRCEPFVGCQRAPDANDADGDGVPDCRDRCPGFDDVLDVDGDGIPDPCDPCVGQLVVDPGFEAGGAGWQQVHHTDRSVVGTMFHSGAQSLQMLVHPRWSREVYQDIPVNGGATYEAGVWARTDELGGTGATASLLWLDAMGVDWNTAGHVLRTDELGALTGTNDWTHLSGRFVAPAGAVVVRFFLFLGPDADDSGAAWFDDASLCEEPGGA